MHGFLLYRLKAYVLQILQYILTFIAFYEIIHLKIFLKYMVMISVTQGLHCDCACLMF